jgi:hypothetical protein
LQLVVRDKLATQYRLKFTVSQQLTSAKTPTLMDGEDE